MPPWRNAPSASRWRRSISRGPSASSRRAKRRSVAAELPVAVDDLVVAAGETGVAGEERPRAAVATVARGAGVTALHARVGALAGVAESGVSVGHRRRLLRRQRERTTPMRGQRCLDRARRAARRDRDAGVLAEAHQQAVPVEPVATRQRAAQCHLGLCGCAGLDQPPQVADPMDVGVDADRGLGEPFDQHQVRGLAADPGQLDQLVDRIGDAPVVALDQDAARRLEVARLGAVEADREDEALEAPHAAAPRPPRRRRRPRTGAPRRPRSRRPWCGPRGWSTPAPGTGRAACCAIRVTTGG